MNKKNILLLSISLFLINKTIENKDSRFVLIKKKDLTKKWIFSGKYDKNLNKIYIPKKINSFQFGDAIIQYTENENSIKAQLILPIENQEKEIKKGINNRNGTNLLNFRNKKN